MTKNTPDDTTDKCEICGSKDDLRQCGKYKCCYICGNPSKETAQQILGVIKECFNDDEEEWKYFDFIERYINSRTEPAAPIPHPPMLTPDNTPDEVALVYYDGWHAGIVEDWPDAPVYVRKPESAAKVERHTHEKYCPCHGYVIDIGYSENYPDCTCRKVEQAHDPLLVEVLQLIENCKTLKITICGNKSDRVIEREDLRSQAETLWSKLEAVKWGTAALPNVQSAAGTCQVCGNKTGGYDGVPYKYHAECLAKLSAAPEYSNKEEI